MLLPFHIGILNAHLTALIAPWWSIMVYNEVTSHVAITESTPASGCVYLHWMHRCSCIHMESNSCPQSDIYVSATNTDSVRLGTHARMHRHRCEFEEASVSM